MKLLMAANTSWNLIHFRGNLIRHLQSLGYSVTACAPRDEYSSSFSTMDVAYRETPMQQRGLSVFSDIVLITRYFQIVRAEGPAAILTFTIKPNLYLSVIAALLRVPIIVNVSGLGYTFIHKSILRWFVIALYKLCLCGAFRVFFQNPDDQSIFIDLGLVTAQQSYLLPGSGVDLSRFHYVEIRNRTSYQRKDMGFQFLFIGRLLHEKGIGEYLSAARILLEQGINATFSIVGAFPDDPLWESHIKEEIKRLGAKARYFGAASDVRPAIEMSDCVVLPSYREGAPRSILEASAMGRPVIVTDVPGCSAVVIDSVTGYLCQPMDAVDLAEKMLRMVSLPRNQRIRMGAAGAQLMRDCFDEKIVMEAYQKALNQCTHYAD